MSTNWNEHTIYVFIRQDLPLEDQLVQALHAQDEMAKGFYVGIGAVYPGTARIITFGVPHPKSLQKAMDKMEAAHIKFIPFTDEDKRGLGITAVATSPLSDTVVGDVFDNYRLWNPKNNTFIAPVEAQAEAALSGDGAANAAVAQSRASG